MIFIRGKLEDTVQVDDKTRLDFRETFISDNDPLTITSMTVEVEAFGEVLVITDNMYIDWVYETDGVKLVTVTVEDDSPNTTVKEFMINVVTAAEDNLFSNDDDIKGYEPDLLRWVEDGRDSFLDKHRIAQTEILDELNNAGYSKSDGSRYEKEDISNIREFQELSKFTALRIIFSGISNAIDDVFSKKASDYDAQAIRAKRKAYLRLDVDGDGDEEKVPVFSGDLRRV